MTPPLIEALRREVMDEILRLGDSDEPRVERLSDIYVELTRYRMFGWEATQEEAAQLRALIGGRA